MIVLLPKEEKTVCNVAWSLTADSWKKMYAQMQRIDVDVKLPRFETESEENLAGTMTPLMPNAFRMDKADFSNLFDVKSCIDRIKQVGHIKVDETGAEASVITSLQGDLGSVKTVQPETVRFHANHPFLYFIREYSTTFVPAGTPVSQSLLPSLRHVHWSSDTELMAVASPMTALMTMELHWGTTKEHRSPSIQLSVTPLAELVEMFHPVITFPSGAWPSKVT